ncbi:hypothetical protein [Lutispora sp.]|nr:hypothetical protein [Lutispora sp.]MEA4962384.1 hypothetical protein [Lutispora sp.]
MDFYLHWIISIEEAIENLIEIGSRSSIKNFFDLLCYPGMYDDTNLSGDAEKMIYLYGDPEENYSYEERRFMKYGERVEKIFNLDCELNENKLCFYYVQINCEIQDRDLVACALIKIVHKAFKGFIGYLIRWNNELCFGAKGTKTENTSDDYIISNWWGINNWKDTVLDFSFDMFEDTTNISTFCEYMETIRKNTHLVNKESNLSKYDRNLINDEYINSLMQLSKIYNFDMSNWIRKKYSQMDNCVNYYCNYETIIQSLDCIGSNTVSSYEMLEQAEMIDKVSEKPASYDSNKDDHNYDDINQKIQSIEESVFEDAEELLKYV